MRLQRLLHVDVDAVAAGGYQHALAGVDLDVSVLALPMAPTTLSPSTTNLTMGVL